MKELVSQAIPRTNDLLSDIQSLQSILESKMELYGDNLIQNGLGWKVMGMPVDEQLIATVKGWFYNLCIGLISELDTECSKLQSLVTDMRELLHHPEGDKVIITEIIINLFYSDIITEKGRGCGKNNGSLLKWDKKRKIRRCYLLFLLLMFFRVGVGW